MREIWSAPWKGVMRECGWAVSKAEEMDEQMAGATAGSLDEAMDEKLVGGMAVEWVAKKACQQADALAEM